MLRLGLMLVPTLGLESPACCLAWSARDGSCTVSAMHLAESCTLSCCARWRPRGAGGRCRSWCRTCRPRYWRRPLASGQPHCRASSGCRRWPTWVSGSKAVALGDFCFWEFLATESFLDAGMGRSTKEEWPNSRPNAVGIKEYLAIAVTPIGRARSQTIMETIMEELARYSVEFVADRRVSVSVAGLECRTWAPGPGVPLPLSWLHCCTRVECPRCCSVAAIRLVEGSPRDQR